MKITVPLLAKEYKLNDREMVFAHMIFYQLKKWGKNTVFYMHGDDVRRLLDKSGASVGDGHLEGIRKVLRVAVLDRMTFRIGYLHDRRQISQGNGAMLPCTVEINDINAIKLYYYILGRVTGSDITTETDDNFKFFEGENTYSKQGASRIVDRFYRKDLTI